MEAAMRVVELTPRFSELELFSGRSARRVSIDVAGNLVALLAPPDLPTVIEDSASGGSRRSRSMITYPAAATVFVTDGATSREYEIDYPGLRHALVQTLPDGGVII